MDIQVATQFPPLSTEPTVQTATTLSPIGPASGAADDLEQPVIKFLGDRDGGVAVRSIREGETTTAVAGNANAAGDPISTDTPFRVGSISKPLIATMVLQLVDEGRVDLDDTPSTYLPDTV